MDDTQLDKIKRRLGIQDAQQDDLLNDLILDAKSHFMLITKSQGVDPKYDFIIRDVVALRYNRKGSEGLRSESVDGYSTTYASAISDFRPYQKMLERDFDLKGEDDLRQKGVVKFL